MKWFVGHKQDIIDGFIIACLVGGVLVALFGILHEIVQ